MKLFNNKDLTGWYTYLVDSGKHNDPKGVFTVCNGELVISGEEYGCITTEESFANYELIVEYKWGMRTFAPRLTKARDNGILIHSQGKDGAFRGFWMYSIECQIIEGGTGDIIVVNDGSEDFSATVPTANYLQGSCPVYSPDGELRTIHKGRINWQFRDPDWVDTFGFRGKHDVENPVGMWNQIRIIAKEATMAIYLNDILVNYASHVTPQSGRIQIQSEGAEMYIRRIELLPL